jgi:hypothetical protein
MVVSPLFASDSRRLSAMEHGHRPLSLTGGDACVQGVKLAIRKTAGPFSKQAEW